MNWRQSAKKAAERIVELEDFNRRSVATVRELYKSIAHIIAGGNICEKCEDYEVCQLKAREEGKGCEDWVLDDVTPDDVNGGDTDGGQGIYGAGAEGRVGAEIDSCKTETPS